MFIYDVRKVHGVFDVIVKKVCIFKRILSLFVTKDKVEIIVETNFGGKDSYIFTMVEKRDEKSRRGYLFRPNGNVDVFVSDSVHGLCNGIGTRMLKYQNSYTFRQIPETLDEELNNLAILLTDKETVRVNPYRPSQILDNGED